MNIGELILLSLSRKPGSEDYSQNSSEKTVDRALSLLKRVYPDFTQIVSGKHVVDFGCGAGFQSIALAKSYECTVVGLDSNRSTLIKAIQNARDHNVPEEKISFREHIAADMTEKFDVVISQNSFEHFPEPEKILEEMSSLLNSEGMILLTFGPPWFAPYGSHMHFFCRIPWINLLFPEKTVMSARSQFRSDGATRYEEVESGLNKMTIGKFESIVSSCNLEITQRNYECVKGINILSKIPLLRELFINHVTSKLKKHK